jgi:hypothetical protein
VNLARYLTRRRLAISLLSLPTLATVGIWIASGFAPRSSRFLTIPAPTWDVWLSPNYLRIEHNTPPMPAAALANTWLAGDTPPFNHYKGRGQGYFLGWVMVSDSMYARGTSAVLTKTVSISLVMPLLLTMPTAWLAVRRWRRGTLHEERRLAGLCTNCGYDIRATPHRCPECGSVPLPVLRGRVGQRVHE